jgi:cardiolipin synthase (CMP-forming)
MPRWLNLPNALTSLRLVLAPFVVYSILTAQYRQTLVLFLIAALSDIADGAAARRWGQGTAAGAILDPIADKCLMSGVYLAFASAHVIPWWFVLLVLGRDLYILIGALLVMRFTSIRAFPPSVWGKLSTFVQICTAVVWMTREAVPAEWLQWLAAFMIWPTAAITVWSGLHYSWRGFLTIRQH